MRIIAPVYAAYIRDGLIGKDWDYQDFTSCCGPRPMERRHVLYCRLHATAFSGTSPVTGERTLNTLGVIYIYFERAVAGASGTTDNSWDKPGRVGQKCGFYGSAEREA